jgi:hypothetical protein
MASSNTSTIVFWNCCGLRRHLTSGAMHTLTNPSFTPHPPSIIVLNETHWPSTVPARKTSTNQLPSISGYTWAYQHHTSRSGGLAVLYHNSVACLPMPALNKVCNPISSDPESSAAVLWHTVRFPHTPPFVLGAAYIPPNDHHRNENAVKALCAAISRATALGLPILLVGDLNLHHADWMDVSHIIGGYPRPPNVLARFVTASALTVLNPVLMPGAVTRPPRAGHDDPGSVIDLAITNAPQLVAAMDTEHAATLVSDHLPITLTMSLKPKPPPGPSYSSPRTQWSVHRNITGWQTALPPAMTAALAAWPVSMLVQQASSSPQATAAACQTTIDTAYGALESIFLQTCRDIVGTHQTSSRDKNWMTLPGVKSAYLRMKATRSIKRHSRRPNVVKTRAAEAAMAQWKSAAKQAMADSWAALCASIQDDPSSPLRWTMFKHSRGTTSSPLGSFPDTSGSAPANIAESLDNLCSYFKASSVPPPLPPHSSEHDIERRYLLPRIPSSPHFSSTALAPHVSDGWTFTAAEVAEQCRRQPTASAPGCDTVLPILLRHAGTGMYNALAAVFTYSWTHGALPQQWTEANVMALYKGKGARSEPSSFRPISVTSIIIRTFEHLVHARLAALLEAKSFFHPMQFGFRKDHSTLDAIYCLQSNTRAMFPTTHTTPCPTLFLDLEKAFDRVWLPKLMQCLEQSAGITGRAWRWLYAFLTRRRIRTVDSNTHSAWQSLQYGVPQGAVLSPLLFIVFINTIARRISLACPRLNTLLFADDMAIQPRAPPLVNGKRQPVGGSTSGGKKLYSQTLVTAFRLLNSWCDETRMRFGKAKTQWVVFDRTQTPFANKDYSRFRRYRLCGFSPEVVEEYEYLGVIHHRQLTWTSQCSQAIQRIRRDSFLLSRVIQPPAGPHFAAVRRLCLGYILPRCTYAMAFWQAHPIQLRAMQAAFIRPMQRSLGLHRTSHHLGLLVEAHCPSFEALRTRASAQFLLRAERLLQSHPQHPTSKALRADRAAEARNRVGSDNLSRVTATTYGKRTAIPHLIHEVLSRLPQLAPLHPLMLKYFPSTAAAGAAAQALPTTLTSDEVNSLTMVDTHREWRAEPTVRYIMSSTAPLLTIKTSPGLSLFLNAERNPMVMVRARIRANRIPTQHRRYTPLAQVDDPSCTFAACRTTAPFFLDTIQHILLACPRHQVGRQQLTQHLISDHNYTTPLSMALITGELPPMCGSKKAQQRRGLALLALTATFLTQVMLDREADPSLSPFCSAAAQPSE